MSLATPYSRSKSRLNWSETYTVLCLVLLATSPTILLGEGNRNLGLIAFMFLSPLFMLRRTLSTEGLILVAFAFSIVFFPAFAHSGLVRWSTVLYSLMFCALFISYDGMLRSGFPRIAVFLNVVRYLIISYAVILIVQQFCVLTGLPIFNVSNYDPSEPWKLNALSVEPSHSARILGLLMLSYIVGRRLAVRMGEDVTVSQRQNTVVWLCFFWSMITMLSATSLVMIFIVLLVYAQRNRLSSYIFGLLMASVVLFLLPDQLTGRVFDLVLATLTLDYTKALVADHSGGLRVAPMLLLVNYVEVFSVNGFFGNGVDSVGLFLSDHIWGIAKGATGGGLLALWYEYGLVAFLLFVFFSLRATEAMKAPANFLIWLLLIFIAGVNNQMVWLAIVLLHTLNFYRKRARRI